MIESFGRTENGDPEPEPPETIDYNIPSPLIADDEPESTCHVQENVIVAAPPNQQTVETAKDRVPPNQQTAETGNEAVPLYLVFIILAVFSLILCAGLAYFIMSNIDYRNICLPPPPGEEWKRDCKWGRRLECLILLIVALGIEILFVVLMIIRFYHVNLSRKPIFRGLLITTIVVYIVVLDTALIGTCVLLSKFETEPESYDPSANESVSASICADMIAENLVVPDLEKCVRLACDFT
jgi:hypothetical protein